MERRYYKAIYFDLDTKKLKEHFPRYQKAYSDLLRFFKKKNFSHRQGSGYVSNEKMTTADIVDIIGDMKTEFEWLGACVKRVDVTNVGVQYDLKELLTPDISDDLFSAD